VGACGQNIAKSYEFPRFSLYEIDSNNEIASVGQHLVQIKMCEMSNAEKHQKVLKFAKLGPFYFSVGW
jgi:hypothetical protein